jgi:hypothetical protein
MFQLLRLDVDLGGLLCDENNEYFETNSRNYRRLEYECAQQEKSLPPIMKQIPTPFGELIIMFRSQRLTNQENPYQLQLNQVARQHNAPIFQMHPMPTYSIGLDNNSVLQCNQVLGLTMNKKVMRMRTLLFANQLIHAS